MKDMLFEVGRVLGYGGGPYSRQQLERIRLCLRQGPLMAQAPDAAVRHFSSRYKPPDGPAVK